MLMDNELDGDLVMDASGEEAAELTSPLARWHLISSALKRIPELRRYLADPRLRPSKVAKLSQKAKQQFHAWPNAGCRACAPTCWMLAPIEAGCRVRMEG